MARVTSLTNTFAREVCLVRDRFGGIMREVKQLFCVFYGLSWLLVLKFSRSRERSRVRSATMMD